MHLNFLRKLVVLLLPSLLLIAAFDAYAQQTPTASDMTGQGVFMQICSKCHGMRGEGKSGVLTIVAPSLQAEHNRGHVIQWIETGGGIMPSFIRLLPQKTINAVADYVVQDVAVIPLQNGDLARGGMLFRIDCAPCHGTAARGGALASAGVNAPSLLNFSAPVVAGAIRWGPGPMPVFSTTAIPNKDLDSIVTYVRFIQNPPHPGGLPMKYYGSVAEGFMAWISTLFLVAVTVWIERKGKG